MKRLSCGAVHVAPFEGPWRPSDCNPGRLNWAPGSAASTAPGGWANDVAADGASRAGAGRADGGPRGPAWTEAGDAWGEANGTRGWSAVGPRCPPPGGSTPAGPITPRRDRRLSG